MCNVLVCVTWGFRARDLEHLIIVICFNCARSMKYSWQRYFSKKINSRERGYFQNWIFTFKILLVFACFKLIFLVLFHSIIRVAVMTYDKHEVAYMSIFFNCQILNVYCQMSSLRFLILKKWKIWFFA